MKLKLRQRKYKILSKPTLIWKNMTVIELAISMKEPVEKIIKVLSEIDYKKNEFDSIVSDFDIIKEVVSMLGYNYKDISDLEDILKYESPHPVVLIKRHPIVTIMGHVDHGKTTLLDSLRMTSVADNEFGGITQHIGAFNVTLGNGEQITFLDTPGHAAFYAMRERGTKVTDIIVLVVAADDGVMKQTVQSIEMANEANVPIIVAINKIDKANINIERTQQMLAKHGVIVEDIGGNHQSVNISAKNGTNLNYLLEAISVQAEIMDLKGDPTGPVEAVIIEATNNIGLGKMTSLIIQRGNLKQGDILVSGITWAKVRSIFDHTGSQLSEAKLSNVVQITGWRDLPVVGNNVYQVKNEKKAHLVIKYHQVNLNKEKSVNQKKVADQKHAEHVIQHKKIKEMRLSGFVSKSEKVENLKDESLKLYVIIKGDVVGSVEAILDVLETYKDKKCTLSIVSYGVGSITASDLELSKTFNAVIYCFNIKIPKTLLSVIDENNIIVSEHNVIYKLIDDIKTKMSDMLPLIQKEETIGEGIVLKEFDVNNKKTKAVIAGCRCTSGVFKKSAFFKILRNGEVIYDGKISEMKHFKNEIETLHLKQEGGLKLNEKINLKHGDVVICYKIVEEPQFINWNPGF
ncbi:PREDICTED: translation initiation factor IF-2, mitochondrial [Ceratosolen solmsi marchali]|uniref:Translation initiation factor IF-2, mitochondrial n=1 Tax=Ceratosolen solmsi marchali TaxID=326594 RepID=A0AAJ6YSV6_9HYME|nr:PREDICTED: translation initiation factor IF-2, mitochondrial [Ceratosolen solmsi marchali]